MNFENPIDLAVETLAEMHAENQRAVPSAQLGIERLTDTLGKPWFAWAALVFIVAWIGINAAFGTGSHAIDHPQFPWLELIVSLASLLMTILILITQNRQDAVSHRRAEITLQMSLVTEQKVAKIIDLLEQLRRDDPAIPNRHDPVAATMAQATDLREAADELQRAQQLAERQQHDGEEPPR